MRLFSIVSAIFLSLLLAVSAHAFGALEGKVPANRTSKVHAFTVADPSTCASPGKPKMTVSTKPKHGKVSFEWGYIPAGKRFRGCAGGRMRAMWVHYTPDAGFRGTDTFAVGYRFADMGGYISVGYKGQKFIVHVK